MNIDIKYTFDIIRIIIGVTILSYATFTDIKTRLASNILWVIMGSIGIIFIIIQFLTIGFDDLFQLVFIPIIIILMFVFFQLRLLFGGADAKAIMALAILLPIQPSIFNFPLWNNSIMPYSWSIFTNALVLFLIIPISLFFYNLINRNIEFPHLFMGYKMNIDQAKKSFVWPLERIKNGQRKLSYMPKDFDTSKEFELFKKKGIEEIWVTPKVPFMIPLLAGFIVSFIFGDILMSFLQYIL